MTRAQLLRTFARSGALVEIARILALFPELRGAVTLANGAIGPPPRREHPALKRATLAHWRKTKASSRNGFNLKGVSLRAALQKMLTDTPRTSAEMQERLAWHGYTHRGTSPLSTRISQELAALVKSGAAQRQRAKGKRWAWSRKGGEQQT